MKWKTYIPCFKNLTYRWLLNMCTFSFLRLLKYSGNWKVLFVNILVRKWSSRAICKIYGFEYVTYARTRFVTAWDIEIVSNSSRKFFFLCFGIRNCIILSYRNFLTRWENVHRENWKMDRIFRIKIR